ncbi:uncharacterized protein K489DRAFT_99422 [Dissoconium aciculare CBS 342.82]|uniref:Uncharacterized protein n=1 Tax=Dissoconium aciculare CBS 342.82 TaxID=1314786 RepID=A0A6J3MCS8_9PEZI|nr:uncharacterized protein K489DRAFT_99422 [Dissoconium aciculare CBS 342.82]KAF1825830.1 hypothetical protein K489DRAFT_99422 [Dissoconium aciculare CBS 342.82]
MTSSYELCEAGGKEDTKAQTGFHSYSISNHKRRLVSPRDFFSRISCGGCGIFFSLSLSFLTRIYDYHEHQHALHRVHHHDDHQSHSRSHDHYHQHINYPSHRRYHPNSRNQTVHVVNVQQQQQQQQ